MLGTGKSYATSFPGSLFSASIVVEKRDPGNEVGSYDDKEELLNAELQESADCDTYRVL